MSARAFSMLDGLAIPNISSGARMALTALLSYRNRTTGLCNPKIKTLIERLGGVHERRLYRWLAELREAGIVISTKHRGPNSYVFHIPLFHSVENVENREAETDENVRSRPDKNVRSRPDKNVRSGGGASLYEPEVFEHRSVNAAAAALPAVRPKVEKSAAAALPLFDQIEHPTPEAAAEELVAELLPVHPESGNPNRAVQEAGKLLASRPGEVQRTVEALKRSHALWRVRWESYAPKRFIPQLWRWIHDGDWEHPPAERKPIVSETWIERRERERLEYDDKTYRVYAENGMWDALREYGGEELVEEWRAKVKAIA